MIKKLDTLYSKIIRSKGYCDRCGKGGEMQTSHIFGRGNKRLRWVLDNAFCFCTDPYGDDCHRWWHNNRKESMEWAEGERDLDELRELMKINAPISMDELQEYYENLKLEQGIF